MSGRRLFGAAPASVALILIALVVTAGITLFQLMFRVGQFDPEWLPIYVRLFAIEDYPVSFLFIGVLALAAVPKLQDLGANLARSIGKHPRAVASMATIVLAAGSFWAYHAQPIAMDEVAPYMQSQIFAHGDLVGRFPPGLLDWLIYQPFENYFIYVSHETGEIASSYWPGFALILTPFMAAGVPWLCNPILGGLSVWVIHRLTLRLTHSLEAAGTATLFAVASGAFMVNAMSFYSMSAHLLCNAVFVLLLLEPTPKRAFAAGLMGGLALTLHNPVPHTMFALPWLVWLVARRDRWPLVAAISAGYLPWIIVVGFGWNHLLHTLTGSSPAATASPAAPIAEAVHTLASLFRVPGESQLLDQLIAICKLWLWASPLLLLLASLGFARRRTNTHFRLLLASFVLTFAFYFFVPLNQGHGWGSRYLHSAWFVLPVFAAAALAPGRSDAPVADVRKTLPLVALTQGAALCSLLIVLPFFLWQVYHFTGHHLAQLPRTNHGKARVVIVSPAGGYYSQDLVRNDPYLREGPMRFASHGRKADEQFMTARFPNLHLLQRDTKGSVWGDPDVPKPAAHEGAP